MGWFAKLLLRHAANKAKLLSIRKIQETKKISKGWIAKGIDRSGTVTKLKDELSQTMRILRGVMAVLSIALIIILVIYLNKGDEDDKQDTKK